ncbi:hypothetical protein GCM10025883_09200 [Mobilicoccus caccae]|uniref:Uncharacterized protein n=1 Tax=Mobilicoccus caccae TaxID=1859295 RepID=A0ABQ6ILR7_9MICO|nr:hypothetical protein GCM10025883_09200 [Mobilicoccus caccae]
MACGNVSSRGAQPLAMNARNSLPEGRLRWSEDFGCFSLTTSWCHADTGTISRSLRTPTGARHARVRDGLPRSDPVPHS